MEKLICSKLHEIEKENNVKILLTDLEKLWENIFLQRKACITIQVWQRETIVNISKMKW